MRAGRNICYIGLGLAFLLGGCQTTSDLQGHDPNEYYAQNPIKNKVETRYVTRLMHMTPGHMLSSAQIHDLRQQIIHISALAVDDVEIHLHPSHTKNKQLREELTMMMIRMGIPRKQVALVSMEEVARHDASIQIAYSAVVSPRCPDWRPSSVSSYTNMTYTPNISCASITNIGLMVADPRDLVQGEGDGTPDTNNTTRAIQQYRSGESSSEEGASETGIGIGG